MTGRHSLLHGCRDVRKNSRCTHSDHEIEALRQRELVAAHRIVGQHLAKQYNLGPDDSCAHRAPRWQRGKLRIILDHAAIASVLGDAASTPPPPPAPSLQAATSVQVMIAAAALNETPQQIRKREAKRVDRGVSLLERLHQASLGGPPEPQVLEELAQWAEEFSLPDSPQLQSLARDVELRVKVELARHERFV